MLPLIVPKGLPLLIAVQTEVRLHEPGQQVRGRTVRPVYAFDHIVIPVGTEVLGRISAIEDLSKKQRTLSALDADFTPSHKFQVDFDELVLADGRRLPIHTVVTRDSGQVLEFVQPKSGNKNAPKSAAAQKVDEAKEEAKRTWDEAMRQIHEPGRMHRLEHYLVAQLPVHPQYLDAGTVYSAELQEPLDFGSEPITPAIAAALSAPPPPESLIHALLVTPLSSATSQQGDSVEAVLSQPLFDREKLILPAGTKLVGSVVQAQPAHKPHRNGKLRVTFHRLVAPDGLEQRVNASLLGVGADKAEHIELDSEGGAQATSPNSRYLTTGIALTLAAISTQTDTDSPGGGAEGNASTRAAGGAAGFKLVGIIVGTFVHSQPLGMAMGALGASRSIYGNFISRGHEVTFPKNTPMAVSISPQPKGRATQE